MADWNETVVTALQELGADKLFTKGAKLKQKVQELGARQGQDFQSFLQESDQKFSAFLETIDDVEIRKSPGTDMYVGLVGAALPPSDSPMDSRQGMPTRLRDDVYRALTVVSEQPYYYIKSTDTFTPDSPDSHPANDLVELPLVALDSLREDRKAFLEQIDDDNAKGDLLRVIESSSNPLIDFQLTLPRYGLAYDWHQYNLRVLLKRLNDWATQNEVNILPSWTTTSPTKPSAQAAPLSPQALLSQLVTYMTEDEVRPVLVPFRAVEAMYRDLNRTRSS